MRLGQRLAGHWAAMDRREKIEHISRLPLFSELTRDEIAQIEPLFSEEHYRAGEYIYRQAEFSFALYLFVEGRGRLLRVGPDGIERRGADVEPGEFVGEKSLFLHEERPNSLVIVRDATVLVLPRARFDEFIRRNPAIKARLNIRDDVRGAVQDQDFPWLQRGEIVLRYTHRHPWAFIRRAAWSLPMLVILLQVPLVIALLPPPFPSSLAPFGLVPALLIPALYVIYTYFDWKNDWFVITNQRVVHEEAVLLTLNETRQQAPLRSIQSVETVQRGYFAVRLGFGDLIVNTAGSGGSLVFDTIDNAEDMAAVLKSELARAHSHSAAEDRQKIRAEIDRFLGRTTLNRTYAETIPQPGAQPGTPNPPRPVRTRIQEWMDKINNYFDIRVRMDEGHRVVYRRHWLVLWNSVFTPAFFLLLTLGAFAASLIWSGEWPWNAVHPLVRVVIFLLLMTAEGFWLWYSYEDWHNDLYIVEDQTVTRIHRRPLWLADERSTILIRNIQGVNVSIRGVWQKALNYGTVIVQTAADDRNPTDGMGGETIIPFIYKPHTLQEDILRRQRREDTKNAQQESDRMAEQIARWLAVYHQATHAEDFDSQPMNQYIDKGQLKGGPYRSEDE